MLYKLSKEDTNGCDEIYELSEGLGIPTNLMIMDNDNTAWRGNSQDPGSRNPAFKGGEGSYPYRVVASFCCFRSLFCLGGLYVLAGASIHS
jgi:hypothetical protein